MIRAVEGFDVEVGTRFATYAAFWVRQSIRHALDRDRNSIRLPHCTWNLLNKWYRASHALRRELGRVPLAEEISSRLELSPKQKQLVLDAMNARSWAQKPGDGEDADVLAVVAAGEHDPLKYCALSN